MLLCFGIGARADNVVSISSVEGAPDTEVTVSIALENTDAVSSMQVSIPLNEELTLVEGSGGLGERCSDHALSVGVKNGVLNVLVYSMSMTPFTGNSGEVASLRLKLGNQPVSIALIPSRVVLTDGNGTTVENTARSGNVTIRCAKAQYNTMEVDFGSVPIRSTYTKTVTVTNVGNEDLTVTNIELSDVNVFSTTTTLPLTLAPGASQALNVTYQPVDRGNIERTMRVVCNSVSKLNTIRLKAQPFAVNELHVQPTSGISDEEVTIAMNMNNMDPISGWQVEFQLPDALQYVDGSFTLSSRKQDHVAITSINNGRLRIIVYSGNDLPMTGNDGEIGSFRVRLNGRNNVQLTPAKVVLSANINNHVEDVTSAVYGATITIRSPRINAASTLNFGAVPVTEACERSFIIRNNGSAPLTISRIVFDNEDFSIKEALPMTINAGNNKAVTICYGSTAQTAFEGTMQIYSNDPEQRLLNVVVRGSRFAPNYLSVSTADVTATGTLSVAIAADTYDPITGLQFDLIYPSTYYESFDNNVQLADRATGMTVIQRQIDEQTIRCFCYFISENEIPAGTGDVLAIRLKPIGQVPEGSYTVQVKNIKLGTSDLVNKYSGADLQSTFTVIPGLKGDIDGDGELSVTDVVLLVNAVMDTSSIDNITKYDMDDDGEVTVTDVVLLVNAVMNN